MLKIIETTKKTVRFPSSSYLNKKKKKKKKGGERWIIIQSGLHLEREREREIRVFTKNDALEIESNRIARKTSATASSN